MIKPTYIERAHAQSRIVCQRGAMDNLFLLGMGGGLQDLLSIILQCEYNKFKFSTDSYDPV